MSEYISHVDMASFVLLWGDSESLISDFPSDRFIEFSWGQEFKEEETQREGGS